MITEKRILTVLLVKSGKQFRNFLENKYFPAGVFRLDQFMKNISGSSEQRHINLRNMQNK